MPLIIALVLVAGTAVVAWFLWPRPQPPEPDFGPPTAAEVVVALEVRDRVPAAGFDRAHFGQTWADVDRNGCDTRNDILRRDLTDPVIKEGTRGCRVESGTLRDRYSGQAIPFERGGGLIEVDHVVSLSDAWQKGAQEWTVERRTEFANDPLNLVATSRALNQQKGPADASSWLPPNPAYTCGYVARQATVKQRYGLWITKAEKKAMLRVLDECPEQPLTGDSD